MLSLRNKESGYEFVWPDYSDFVEVYRKDVSFSDQPYEVVSVAGMPRDMSTLNVLAFQTSDYAKPPE